MAPGSSTGHRRGGKPRRGRQARESSANLFAGTLWRATANRLEQGAAKPRRGGPVGPTAERVNSPGREKPRRVAVPWMTSIIRGKRTLAGSKTLKRRLRPTSGGYRHPRGCTALLAELGPGGRNPKDGTGTKQGRQVPGGTRPREREKRWGGSVPEAGSSGEVAARYRENVEGEQTAREAAASRERSRPAVAPERSDSGGERKVRSGCPGGRHLPGSRRGADLRGQP
jgi:hypothetical protein